ncbi:MAG: hypothetical protein A2103_01195 [Gammaproteobacteria bacterium GWF2_41_13]|nr:MAG: hypothetical protein A2103_01195 [Gammaproteobacteria bacterium GWF2_41_13]
MNYLVSVITVVYNSAKTIERCIKSVLIQDYQNLEYIVIDGGSTDGTVEIIEKYRDKIAYFRSQSDQGIYDAMNAGIQVAKGDIIVLLNADDWFEADAISIGVDTLARQNKADIVHANIMIHKNDKQQISRCRGGDLSTFFWKGMRYNHPSFFVRRAVYERHLYDMKYKIAADYKFTMMCLKDEINFYFLDQALVHFQAGGKSSCFWARLYEGHRIRIDLGFNGVLVLCSTVFQFSWALASLLKNRLRNIKKIMESAQEAE